VKTPPVYALFGVPFHDVTFDETVDWAVERMKQGPPGYLATANVDFLTQAWRDPELQRILLEADLVVADGMPIVWSAGRFGPRLRQRVTGSDLVPRLAAACARERLRVFLLGGGPGVADAAGLALKKRHPDLIICGTYSPPKADVLALAHDEILTRLAEARPHLLLVAFGAPKQEKFINLHVRSWSVPLAVGVGGSLDFIAGAQRRAPVLLQRLGLEWLWRMTTDPRRLFGRYIGNLRFFFTSYRALRRQQFAARRAGLDPSPEVAPAAWQGAVVEFRDGQTMEALLAAVAQVSEPATLVLDLARRRWLDSAALGRLLQLARELTRTGRRLVLWRPPAPVEAHLRTCRLANYLSLCRTTAEVDAQVAQDRSVRRTGVVGTDSEGGLRLWLPAELTAGNVAEWRATVNDSWPRTRHSLVLVDGGGARFMDSAGIGWLVSVRKRAQEEGLIFRATGFSGPVLKVLQLARVSSYLLE
jgi:N-acetylglucosaminyldiphosphoundecaprenol N-acetyl-beta-D-mannosaminyltransferase